MEDSRLSAAAQAELLRAVRMGTVCMKESGYVAIVVGESGHAVGPVAAMPWRLVVSRPNEKTRNRRCVRAKRQLLVGVPS